MSILSWPPMKLTKAGMVRSRSRSLRILHSKCSVRVTNNVVCVYAYILSLVIWSSALQAEDRYAWRISRTSSTTTCVIKTAN
jgi:hypothetical protein